MDVNIGKLDRELKQAGVPIHGCHPGPRINFRDDATAEHRARAAAILAAHDPYDYAAERAKEYPSTAALVVALWERFVEGRPEAAAALQAQREAVKAKWPKGGKP